MSAVIDEQTSLVLHELEAELPQECDFEGACTASVEWEAVCRLCGGWGLLCSEHQAFTLTRQRFNDGHKGGTRCTACDQAATDLLSFSPVRSRDERKLW